MWSSFLNLLCAVISYHIWYNSGYTVQFSSVQFSSVQSLSIWLFATPWTAAHQASLSIINSQGLLKLISFELVMLSNHLILSSPSPPTFNHSQHQLLFKWVSWSKYWSFRISPSNEYSGLISFRIDWFRNSLLSKGLWRVFSNTTVQNHQFFGDQLSL